MFHIAGVAVPAGEARDVWLPVSETYVGTPVSVPLRILRGARPGPALFVTAAVHGDEWNGTGIVRELMRRPPRLVAGTLLCVPVVNLFGFEAHSRYLPERRDLNRCFPGRADGNLAERLAHAFFEEVVPRSDFGIELHTAPARRTNFPTARGDLSDPGVRRLAFAFGCEVVLHKKGERGSLRRAATERGCPTLLLEAGEALRFEPEMIAVGVRGVRNVLRELGMTAGEVRRPRRIVTASRSLWLRASRGGILRLDVAPGSAVRRGAEVARCEDLLGRPQERIVSPVDGVVVGLTTLPAVRPGEPVCHLAIPDPKGERPS